MDSISQGKLLSLILTPDEFRNKLLKKNQFVLLASYENMQSICFKF